MYIHTFTQTVHLELTDPVAHLGLLECEEPPLFQRNTQAAVAWVLAVDLRRCSKSCQSASAVLHGWERQDSRADFSVFFYTGEGSACQHTSAQQHLKAVDFLFITASRTAFLFFFWVGVYVLDVRVFVWLENRLLSKETNDLWLL